LGLGQPGTVPVIVTNHSAAYADYAIKISLRNNAGKEIDSTQVFVSKLLSGATTTETAEFSSLPDTAQFWAANDPAHPVLISAKRMPTSWG
jgi:hypothetical protein